MSADFHLFLRLMIRYDCEFFRSAFVVLEAICPLTFVERQSLKLPQMILERNKKVAKGLNIFDFSCIITEYWLMKRS